MLGWWLRVERPIHDGQFGLTISPAMTTRGLLGHPRVRSVSLNVSCWWGLALTLWFGRGAWAAPSQCGNTAAVWNRRSSGGTGPFGEDSGVNYFVWGAGG